MYIYIYMYVCIYIYISSKVYDTIDMGQKENMPRKHPAELVVFHQWVLTTKVRFLNEQSKKVQHQIGGCSPFSDAPKTHRISIFDGSISIWVWINTYYCYDYYIWGSRNPLTNYFMKVPFLFLKMTHFCAGGPNMAGSMPTLGALGGDGKLPTMTL